MSVVRSKASESPALPQPTNCKVSTSEKKLTLKNNKMPTSLPINTHLSNTLTNHVLLSPNNNIYPFIAPLNL